jgi:HD-like signal output (HDOD) protein
MAATSQKQLDSIGQAFQFMEKVVEMVKQDKLPGPVVPGMLTEALELFADPGVSFEAVATFGRKHQTVSARLLAIANSAYYARPGGRVGTLESAISRIGLTATRDLIQAVAAKAYMVGRDPVLQAMILEKLRTAYFIALLCNELARRARFRRAGDAQAVGLFHNIGQVFLLYTLALMRDKGLDLDLDASMIAAALAERSEDLNRILVKLVKLPPEIVAVFSASESSDPESETMVGFVHQSIWISDRLAGGISPAELELDDQGEVLGLTEPVVGFLKDRLPPLLEAVEAYGK